MIMTRSMAENALLSKHTLRVLPFVDSDKEEHIEEIAGNELRVLKRYPIGYDFVANMIQQARIKGIERFITDVDANYFKAIISDATFHNYFKNCGNNTIRQSLKRQLLLDLNKGFTLIYGQDKKMGKFISQRRPFVITAKTEFETGKEIIEILFSKAVFGSLVDETVFKKGGDGYIEIPYNFYPTITRTNIGKLDSHNPVYKVNILGLLKNTHKIKSVDISRKEFIDYVCPEYFRMGNDGYYHFDSPKPSKRLISPPTPLDIYSSITGALAETQQLLPDDLLVKNFTMYENSVALDFNACAETETKKAKERHIQAKPSLNTKQEQDVEPTASKSTIKHNKLKKNLKAAATMTRDVLLSIGIMTSVIVWIAIFKTYFFIG